LSDVPTPTFGPTGFLAPSEADILVGVLDDLSEAFGGNLNPGLSTPQGQLASSLAAIIGDANAMFLWFCSQVDPAFTSGRMQDAIGRIYYIERIPGTPTVQECQCNGLPGTQIPVGALVQDGTGALWVCQEAGTIGQNGNIVLPFAASQNGPTAGPVSLNVYQAIIGWDSVSPSDNAVLGGNVESPSQFEARRAQSTALNSSGQLPSVLGAVLAVPGVIDAYVIENPNPVPIVVGGVTLGANSLYVCVLGGAAAAVAQAIWTRKAPGCNYTGNTTVIVTDPSPSYNPPAPSYNVTFETPTIVPFAMLVTLKNGATVPSSVATQVQNAIVAAFAGLDGGSRARIGSLVLASRYYGDITALGAWAQIVEIQLGESGTAAQLTGSISGTTLSVTALASGTIGVGQLLQGSGILAGTGAVITALAGGTGSTGNYTISPSQFAASGSMTATNLVNSQQLNINQAPSISAAAVYLNLV
jgi:hypothetical protein